MSTLLAGLASAAAFIVPILIALVAVVVAMAVPAALLGGALYVLLTDFQTVVAWFRTYILPHLSRTWNEIQAILAQVSPELRELGEVGLYLLGEAVKDTANAVKAAVQALVSFLPMIRRAAESLGLGVLFDIARTQFANARGQASAREAAEAAGAVEGGSMDPAAATGGATRRAGGGRSSVNNDFRGSRINIHQEFRQQDPDRIAVATLGALSSAGERRIASGYAPAVTR